jgi:hypothetical protein
MARQTLAATLKLVVFVTLVTACSVATLVVNRGVRDRESALSNAGHAELRTALEKLVRDPAHLSMTMKSNCGDERVLRRIFSQMVEPPDILLLGQSDGDHMSGTFFRDGVRFYNSFISNSFFAYHYEAFEDVVSRGTPALLLYDVRSGYLLKEGPEPAYDAPKDDKDWWYGAPNSYAPPRLTLDEVESLLSLSQTVSSGETLWRRWKDSKEALGEQVDDGAPYRVVSAEHPSQMDRWLADGSRVYAKEDNAIIVPRGQERVDEQTGERHVNTARLRMLAGYLGRIHERVSDIVVYSPPVAPTVLEDPTQAASFVEFDERMREVASELKLEFCDFASKWKEIGCLESDFYDEQHSSRHCNRQVLHELVSGCAPRLGPKLRAMVKSEIVE